MSKEIYEQVLSLRASGYVKRWHTIFTHRQQSVAEHSVQALTLMLCIHPSPSPLLIKAMLWHDSNERLVGDVPAPIRREFPSFAQMYENMEDVMALRHHPCAVIQLDDDEKRWLKAIDVLELMLFCREEHRIGNSDMAVVYERARKYLADGDTPKEVQEFVDWYADTGQARSLV